jgi:hypothetical protein
LDLDILLYDDFVIGGSNLVIPHERLAERAFVLVPLNEIAPDAVDPRTGNSVSQLLKQQLEAASSGSNEDSMVVRIKSDLWQPVAAGHSAVSEWPRRTGYE